MTSRSHTGGKPANSFILFRRSYMAKHVPKEKRKDQGHVSKLASAKWNLLKDRKGPEYEKWLEAARREAAAFEAANPDYVPPKRTKKKKARSASPRAASTSATGSSQAMGPPISQERYVEQTIAAYPGDVNGIMSSPELGILASSDDEMLFDEEFEVEMFDFAPTMAALDMHERGLPVSMAMLDQHFFTHD